MFGLDDLKKKQTKNTSKICATIVLKLYYVELLPNL